MHDVRFALRSLRRQPGFAALALLIVALGAGANAAVFSVVHAVLLRPLAYAEPDRLVAVAPESFFSPADVQFLGDRVHAFSDVASSSPGWMMSMLGAGEPVQIVAARPSGNLFRMLGVEPLAGRILSPGDATAGRHRVAVLGYRLWQTRFGGDRSAVGRVVTLDGAPYEIVGVIPATASVLDDAADAWVPFDPRSGFARNRTSLLYARLRPGADVQTASRELQALLPDMRRELGLGESVRTLHAERLDRVLVGDVREPLLFVALAVGLLIMLTAANLGTLLLGREIGRRREAAVRSALGASRLRLARQKVVESATLALLGAFAGVAMARLALPSLVLLLPREIPRLSEVGIDGLTLTVVLLVTTVAVIAFGVTPSLIATPTGLQPFLRQGAQTDARGTRRTLDVLVVAQLGLAVVLGVGAALMVRSLWALQRVDPGFAADRVLTLRLQPAGERYRGNDRILAYYRSVAERVAAVPGVETTGLINHLPLSGYNWVMSVQPGDAPPSSGAAPRIGWRMIDGRYFAAMDIPLKAGRIFVETDDTNGPPVAILNETAARRFFGSPASAIGRRVSMSGPTGRQRAEIVGVVGDVRHASIAIAPQPELYRPIAQTFGMATTLVVRTAAAPGSISAAVREAVWSIDPNIAIAGMGPLTTAVRANLGRPRMLATLLFVFAVVGLAVVLCGVYGVVAYSVRRREREIGIRLALGAARTSIGALVVRQGVSYAAMGLVIGVPASLAVSQMMRGLLYGVGPSDPVTVVALCGLIAAAAVGATLAPAWRAQRIPPAAVLKGE